LRKHFLIFINTIFFIYQTHTHTHSLSLSLSLAIYINRLISRPSAAQKIGYELHPILRENAWSTLFDLISACTRYASRSSQTRENASRIVNRSTYVGYQARLSHGGFLALCKRFLFTNNKIKIIHRQFRARRESPIVRIAESSDSRSPISLDLDAFERSSSRGISAPLRGSRYHAGARKQASICERDS